nr:hypothetical protein [Limnobaculum xujianqingii]
MTGKFTAAVSLIAMLAILTAVWQWHEKTVAKAAEQKAVNELNISAGAMGNILRLTTVFNLITEDRAREKVQDQYAGEQRRADNHADLQGVSCAAGFVPDSVQRRLLDRANSLRTRTLSTATGGTSDTHTDPVSANERRAPDIRRKP